MYMSLISSKKCTHWLYHNVRSITHWILCHLYPNPKCVKTLCNTYNLILSSILMYFNIHSDITVNSCKVRPLPVASTSNYYQSEDAFVPLVHTNRSTTNYCYKTASWSGQQNVWVVRIAHMHASTSNIRLKVFSTFKRSTWWYYKPSKAAHDGNISHVRIRNARHS